MIKILRLQKWNIGKIKTYALANRNKSNVGVQ